MVDAGSLLASKLWLVVLHTHRYTFFRPFRLHYEHIYIPEVAREYRIQYAVLQKSIKLYRRCYGGVVRAIHLLSVCLLLVEAPESSDIPLEALVEESIG